MVTFNPTTPHPLRALQAWQILVGTAMNRQTLTYLKLSEKMYQKPAPGVLSEILGHIAFYCNDNELPALTSLVVGKGRGTPGQDIPANLSEIDAIRESVYEQDWYDIVPPTPEQLKESFDRHT